MGAGDNIISNPTPDADENIGAFNGDTQADPQKLLADSQAGQPTNNTDQVADAGDADVSPGQRAADVSTRLTNVDGVVNGYTDAEGRSWGQRCQECAPDQFDALMASVNELRDNLFKSAEITGVGMGPAMTASLKNPLQTPAEATQFLRGLNDTVEQYSA
jgi:hypothetical protein